jgi:hypothetical protein
MGIPKPGSRSRRGSTKGGEENSPPEEVVTGRSGVTGRGTRRARSKAESGAVRYAGGGCRAARSVARRVRRSAWSLRLSRSSDCVYSIVTGVREIVGQTGWSRVDLRCSRCRRSVTSVGVDGVVTNVDADVFVVVKSRRWGLEWVGKGRGRRWGGQRRLRQQRRCTRWRAAAARGKRRRGVCRKFRQHFASQAGIAFFAKMTKYKGDGSKTRREQDKILDAKLILRIFLQFKRSTQSRTS